MSELALKVETQGGSTTHLSYPVRQIFNVATLVAVVDEGVIKVDQIEGSDYVLSDRISHMAAFNYTNELTDGPYIHRHSIISERGSMPIENPVSDADISESATSLVRAGRSMFVASFLGRSSIEALLSELSSLESDFSRPEQEKSRYLARFILVSVNYGQRAIPDNWDLPSLHKPAIHSAS